MDRLDPQTTPYQTSGQTPTPTPTTDTFGDPTAGMEPRGAFDPWRYRDDAGVTGADLIDYKVEATDGGIGKIDNASHDVDSSYLVVDTGPWIFGRRVMLPAGVVNHADHDERKVYIDRTKDQVKAAPEFEDNNHIDPAYRDKLGGYYGDTYGPSGIGLPPRLM